MKVLKLFCLDPWQLLVKWAAREEIFGEVLPKNITWTQKKAEFSLRSAVFELLERSRCMLWKVEATKRNRMAYEFFCPSKKLHFLSLKVTLLSWSSDRRRRAFQI